MNIDLWPKNLPPEVSGKLGTIQNHNADGPDFVPHLLWMPSIKSNNTTILIIPGGGYSNRVDYKGDNLGSWLNELGYHVAVLRYRKSPYIYPTPQRDALRAIRLLRARSEELGMQKDRLVVCGASAGGHLAGSVSLFHDQIERVVGDEIDQESGRPDRLALIYPVVSMVNRHHEGSAYHLLGGVSTWKQRLSMSLELHVNANTPPTYLVHSVDDQDVPVTNSYLFASALYDAGVHHELLILPKGGHGWEFVDSEDHTSRFKQHFGDWLARQF